MGDRVAIISDIHANLEALRTVLEDIDRRGIEEIHCLGDVVGYGPDPVACVDLVRERCRTTIRGNHDEALLRGPWGFNQYAREAIEWTRRQLRPRVLNWRSRARWRFLAQLPLTHWRGDWLLVHGSPRDPTSEYVLPQQVAWPPPGMFEEIFAAFSSLCFVGHTHIPGLFTEEPAFTPSSRLEEGFSAGDRKLLVNVGSVGQSRDQDWRACYVTCEDGVFHYRRLEYPVEETQRKIRAIPELDDRLADRLASGC